MMRQNDRKAPAVSAMIAMIAVLWVSGCGGGADIDALKKELIDQHREEIEAHLDGDVDLITGMIAGDYLALYDGKIEAVGIDEMRSTFTDYLGSTEFTEYRDLEEPVIEVSGDGTMAWGAYRVKVAGVRTGPEGSERRLDFICSWITVYRRESGSWFRVADASTFASSPADEGEKEASMNNIAEKYVRLALALGQHDRMYIDAYYGPEEWKEEAASTGRDLASIVSEADSLIASLGAIDTEGMEEIHTLRHRFLARHLEALSSWARIKNGEKMSFDEEAEALYDTKIPHYSEDFFAEALAGIDAILPAGEGPLVDRLEAFREGFVIPADKVAEVFSTVLDESRKRTSRYIELPEGESFDVEYVTGTSWGAYNWYKGKAHSLIQVNTDLPTFIDSPLGLAAHEGYPGHHVYNALLERHLTEKRGWVEYSVYPLFSPLSLLAEGTANYGIEIAFPGRQRLDYEKRVLYPIAGIDTLMADEYSKVQKLAKKLSRARIQAARLYLDGEMTVDETVDYLGRNALISADRARKIVTFFDEFRSYIINYYVGYDLVKEYIEGIDAASDDPGVRWKQFEKLLSTPRVPSDLK